MPKVALTDTLGDWERLIRAAEGRAGEHPALRKYIDALRVDLENLHRLVALRDRLTGQRQETTQQLHAVRDEGKLAAICLRQQLKSELGPRNEGLTEFGVRPLRRRS